VLHKEIGILEPVFFSDRAIKTLNRIGNVSLFENGEISSFLNDKEIIFIRLNYYIDINILNSAPLLKYICTPTTGLTHINMKDINSRRIEVFSLKGENVFLSGIRATPEHLFGLTLALLRKYKDCFFSPEEGIAGRYRYIGEEIYKSRVGIIGFGRIGKILAGYFNCFGAKVFFYDKDPGITGFPYTSKMNSIAEVIESANIIILCASYKNEVILTKEHIDLLEDKFFINGARGELIDEVYLLDKLEKRKIKGVALDVISSENMEINNLKRFVSNMEYNNLILTPHIGGATHESLKKTEEYLALKLVNYLLNKNKVSGNE
jgi:D-3-phosphoglycerate dehydrogenase